MTETAAPNTSAVGGAAPGHAYRRHALGLAMTTFAVVVMSFDALLLRLIDGDVWSVAVWRGLLAGSTLWLALMVWRGPTGAVRAIAGLGFVGIAAACIYGVGVVSFVSGLAATSVATILVIMAATPLFSALAAALLFANWAPRRTWIAMVFGFIGVWIAVSGPASESNITGVATCLLSALSLGTYLAVLQHVTRLDTLATTGLGNLLCGSLALFFGDPLSFDATQMGYMLLLGLVVLPLSFGLFTLGPRYISGAETGLVLLLETVLGPFWVWLVLSDRPEPTAVLGGAVVVTTLAVNAVLGLRAARRPVERVDGAL
ncbi:MAG: EamA family transporter [Rhizobiales bacterium]|nr:EamA family transporter [Hyphomicrobiales bacterium]